MLITSRYKFNSHHDLRSLNSPPHYRIYAALNRVIIDFDNGFSALQFQAFIQTNAGFPSVIPQGSDFADKFRNKPIFID